MKTALPYQDVSVSQLETLGRSVRRIDVREPEEFHGPLGHLPGAELVPLSQLAHAVKAWPREQAVLVICRSGGRSAQAARLLAELGFTRVYNLAGGMVAVQAGSPKAGARP